MSSIHSSSEQNCPLSPLCLYWFCHSENPSLLLPSQIPGSLGGQLQYVGGVDVSFSEHTPNLACAVLAILSFPDLHLLHTCHEDVYVTEPYISGFLAFREVIPPSKKGSKNPNQSTQPLSSRHADIAFHRRSSLLLHDSVHQRVDTWPSMTPVIRQHQ